MCQQHNKFYAMCINLLLVYLHMHTLYVWLVKNYCPKLCILLVAVIIDNFTSYNYNYNNSINLFIYLFIYFFSYLFV